MLKIACEDLEKFDVSDIELGIKEQIYAADAFNLIEKEYPKADIYFILGADNFSKITEWKDANEIIQKYNYIVLERKEIDIDNFIKNNETLRKNIEKIQIIKNEEYKNYSSTEFRNLLNNNRHQNQEIISKDVLDYIIKSGVYK